MTEGAGKDDSNSLTRGLEVSKVLATTVVVLYVLDFLVVTFHLAQFGFVPVSWLRPQYLLAGVWCLLPMLMLVWIVSYGGGQAVVLLDQEHRTRSAKAHRYRYAVVVLLIVVVIALAIRNGFHLIALALGQPLNLSPAWPHTVIALKLAGFYLALYC